MHRIHVLGLYQSCIYKDIKRLQSFDKFTDWVCTMEVFDTKRIFVLRHVAKFFIAVLIIGDLYSRQTDAFGNVPNARGALVPSRIVAKRKRHVSGAASSSALFSSPINPSTGSDQRNSVSKESSKEVVTLLEKFDQMGLALKPKAVAARDAAIIYQESNKFMSLMYTTKACMLIFLFIMYRAYRGFFVVLPAVFREVYKKMEDAIESPFDEEIDVGRIKEDIDPKTGKVRLRTRITVSFLSILVTGSYVVGGALRVLLKFFNSLFTTSSVEKSFEAAADQVMVNEKQISLMAKRNSGSKTNNPTAVTSHTVTKPPIITNGIAVDKTRITKREDEDVNYGKDQPGDTLRP